MKYLTSYCYLEINIFDTLFFLSESNRLSVKHLCDFEIDDDHGDPHFGTGNDVLFMYKKGGDLHYYKYVRSENQYISLWKILKPSEFDTLRALNYGKVLTNNEKLIMYLPRKNKTYIYNTDFEEESNGTVDEEDLLLVNADRLVYKNCDENTLILNVYSLDFKFMFSLLPPDGKVWTCRVHVCAVPDSGTFIVKELLSSSLDVFSSAGKLSYQCKAW